MIIACKRLFHGRMLCQCAYANETKDINITEEMTKS